MALWTTDNAKTNELMKRILPAGLLEFLESDDEVQILEKYDKIANFAT